MHHRFVISRQTARNTIVLLSSNALKLGTGFVATLLLAKVLEPDDFGRFSLVTNLALTISAITDFGLGITVVRLYGKKRDESQTEGQRFLGSMLGLRLLISISLFLFLLIVLPRMMYLFVDEHVSLSLSRIACLVMLGDSILTFVLALFQTEENFFSYALINSSANIVRLAAIVILYLLHQLDLTFAVLTFGLSTLFAGLAGLALNSRLLPKMSLPSSLSSLRGIIFWSKWLLLQTIANTIFVKLDLLMLGYFRVANSSVGSYALGLRFVYICIVLQMSIMTILLPKVSALQTLEEIRMYIRKSIKLSLMALPVLLLMGVVGVLIINFLYGTLYQDAAQLFILLYIPMTLSIIAMPIILLSFALDRPQIPAFQNLAGVIILVCLLSILIPLYGVWGAAVAVMISKFTIDIGAVSAVLVHAGRKFPNFTSLTMH